MSQPELENEDLPWWTEDELQQVTEERYFLEQVTNALMFDADKKRINADMPLTEAPKVEPLYFHQAVLDKYRNNPYCDIGNETADQRNICLWIQPMMMVVVIRPAIAN